MARKGSSSKAHTQTAAPPTKPKLAPGASADADPQEREGLLSGAPASPDGSDLDIPARGPRSRARIAAVAAALILLLVGATFGPALLGYTPGRRRTRPHLDRDALHSNGTHDFRRTVLVVSIDGLRAEYLERGLTPHLLDISRKGMRAKFMQPIFPTLTFPNHWALMTGLYAESHGIVANNFWDPDTGLEFHYSSAKTSWNASWWLGEPMWETARDAGMITANLMWPGPPVTSSGASPTYFVPWRNHAPLNEKLAQLLAWIDLPLGERPQLLLAYEPTLDQAGHLRGPNSALVNATLGEVDRFARDLVDSLAERNLTDIVDIVIVSDHGMTDTSHPTNVFIDGPDLLGAAGYSAISHEDGWPSMGLRFASDVDDQHYLNVLRTAAAGKYKGVFEVFTPETMPDRYHFSAKRNNRIAPIYIVPSMGYALTNAKENGTGMSKGNHGYDNEEESMHAMFVAHGPFSGAVKDAHHARRRRLTSADDGWHSTADDAYVMNGFRNVEIYNLVMTLLGIEPRYRAPNNGTDGFWDRYLES